MTASRGSDGSTVEVLPDSVERVLPGETDWLRLATMTDDEVTAAATSDPDAQPLTSEDFRAMKRVPQAKIIRRAHALSQDEFAARFYITLGMLRDWEQGVKEPDAAARAYLVVVGRGPAAVAAALRERPQHH